MLAKPASAKKNGEATHSQKNSYEARLGEVLKLEQ